MCMNNARQLKEEQEQKEQAQQPQAPAVPAPAGKRYAANQPQTLAERFSGTLVIGDSIAGRIARV